MPSINLLDPSLGIQTIMESPTATRGGFFLRLPKQQHIQQIFHMGLLL